MGKPYKQLTGEINAFSSNKKTNTKENFSEACITDLKTVLDCGVSAHYRE